MRPHPVLAGHTLGLCAPSSYVETAQLEAGKAVLENMGYRVVVHPQATARLGQTQIAGTVAERVQAFHDLVRDPEIHGIIFAGGGNRALELVPHLDFARIASARKPIMGFSDATALLNAITARTGLITLHGPVAKWLPRISHTEDQAAFAAALAAQAQNISWSSVTISAGATSGPLFGGNLSVFMALLPDPAFTPPSGALLFLEETGEELSRIDRAFLALRPWLKAKKISGLILGDFGELKDTGRPFGFSWTKIVQNAFGDLGIPVVTQAPFGHGARLLTLPLGAHAHLQANTDHATLDISA